MSFFDPNSTENEGRFRLHDPKYFKNYFRLHKYKGLSFPGISYVMGLDTRDNKIKPQAIRFDKKLWTDAKARKWWEKHKKYFERTWKKSDWKKVAYAPKHPEKVIIKPNEFYPEGLREKDIYEHWMEHKDDVLEYVDGRNVMEVRLLDRGDVIYIRRAPKTGEPLKLTAQNYEDVITGRTVEIHAEFREKDDLGYIDIDPHDVDFKKTKKVTAEVYEVLKRLKEVENLSVVFSGHQGFHIFIFFKTKWNIDNMRKFLRELMDEKFGDRDDLTTSLASSGQIRLDTTLVKRRGTFKVPYSLDRRTGLTSLPIKPSEILKFRRTQAKIKLVGK